MKKIISLMAVFGLLAPISIHAVTAVSVAKQQLTEVMGSVKELETIMDKIKKDGDGNNPFHHMVNKYKAVKNQHLIGELLDVLEEVNKGKLKAALNQKNKKGKDPSDIAPSWMKSEIDRHN